MTSYDTSRRATEAESQRLRKSANDLACILGRAASLERIARRLLEIHGPTEIEAAGGQEACDCEELADLLPGVVYP